MENHSAVSECVSWENIYIFLSNKQKLQILRLLKDAANVLLLIAFEKLCNILEWKNPEQVCC